MTGDIGQSFAAAVDAVHAARERPEEPRIGAGNWRLYRDREVPLVPLELSRGPDAWEPIEAPRTVLIFGELRRRHNAGPVDAWIGRLEAGHTVQVGPSVWLRARRIEPEPLDFTR